MELNRTLVELMRRGIRLKVVDGRLVIIAPPGSMTPELSEAIQMHREVLIRLLEGEDEECP